MRVAYLHGLHDAGGRTVALAGDLADVPDAEGLRLVAAGVAAEVLGGDDEPEAGGEKRTPETPEKRSKRRETR